jgi:hypothetical protein
MSSQLSTLVRQPYQVQVHSIFDGTVYLYVSLHYILVHATETSLAPINNHTNLGMLHKLNCGDVRQAC